MGVASSGMEPGRVRVDGLWERFRVYHSRPRGLKERLFRMERAHYEEFWALRDVSFSLEPGETVAVIGANGSGKSTLLKCLTGILPPDRGGLEVGGTVASLLELGAGFHGDLTGRENVYLNASILGFKRRQVEEAMDRIVAFSGIGDFIDSPVRNYSSGMYVRLGFSVAVHVDPDVLLVDEILAVGDAAFQTKCFEKMYDFKRRNKTIVVVTHDLDSAARLCDRAMLVDHGQVVADDAIRHVIDVYRQRVLTEELEGAGRETLEPGGEPLKRWGTGGAQILDVHLLDERDRPVESVQPGDVCTFSVRVRFDTTAHDPVFGFILHSDEGHMVYNTNTLWQGNPTGVFEAGQTVEVRFRQKLGLLPRRYVFTTAIAHRDGTQWFDWWDDCLFFHVRGTTSDHGYVDLRSEISFEIAEHSTRS